MEMIFEYIIPYMECSFLSYILIEFSFTTSLIREHIRLEIPASINAIHLKKPVWHILCFNVPLHIASWPAGMSNVAVDCGARGSMTIMGNFLVALCKSMLYE